MYTNLQDAVIDKAPPLAKKSSLSRYKNNSFAQKYRKSILIADADENDRLIMRKALDCLGCAQTSEIFPNETELLSYLMRLKNTFRSVPGLLPHLIFLDINMPNMTGLSVVRTLHNDPIFRNIPVVAVSQTCTPMKILGAMNNGACFYMTKPHSFEAWCVKLDAVIGMFTN